MYLLLAVLTISLASSINGQDTVIDCGRSDIPDPENGRVMADQTIIGSVATFTCNANFVLVGDATRTCESTGWSGNNPSCLFDCGREDIPNPENGQVTADATTLGSVATFTCNTNFTLVGDEMRTCESSGWSGTNPTCVFDCGRSDIPDPENGRVMADQTILRSVATFSCNANFVLVGDATRTCESTGWSGNNPSCVFDCGREDIPNPENGQVTADATTLGSVATFTCNDGFILAGDTNRTCLSSGWSGTNAICEIIDCGIEDIPDPENGQVIAIETTFGSVANFTCNTSFVLVGDDMRTCESSGWSGTNTTCVFDCGRSDIPDPENGRVMADQTILRSVATFSCNANFVLVGDATRTCESTGWSGNNPSCLFNCGREDIPNPENGQVTADATTLGSVATFTCNTNFTLVGDEMRTCESSGWSGRNPSCVFDCGRSDIPNPENGQVTADATTLGSVATFTCNTSFVLVGDEMRTCESSGWSGRNPLCVFDCGRSDIPDPENGLVMADQTILGSVATFSCNANFVLVGDGTRTCESTGWSGNNPSCLFDCGRSDIPDPENGRVMADQTILRSVATFSCNANFVLVGDATRTCESTGWSGNNPSCVFDCGNSDLRVPSEGMIAFTRLNDGIDSRQTTLLNTIATFKCNDGFELVGEPTRTCELSGWSGSNPTCVIDCGRSDIPRPRNGSVMANQTTLGSIATFTCDASFILVGDEMRTCESTGWSGNNPTCVFSCGTTGLETPVNGRLSLTQKTLSSVASFACDAGFALIGDATRTCELTGWSGSNPSCLFDCGSTDIIRPDNGTVTLTTTTLGSVAAFTCDTSFVLTGGNVTRTCQTTGWTGSNPSCIFDCTSTEIERPENGNVNFTTTTIGSRANFSCNTGFALIGDATRTCQLTGWSGSNPTCVHDCGSGDIVKPADGTVDLPATTLNAIATFSCDIGFRLQGDATRTCQLTGWSGSNPSCKLIDCGSAEIVEPENGQVNRSEGTTFNARAIFSCDENFTLVGDEVRVCGQSGWSGENPTCAFDCGLSDIEMPSNGSVSIDSTILNARADFMCDIGFTLLGNATRTCQLTGWNGSNPSCQIIDCGDADIVRPMNGSVSLTTTTFGSRAVFSCDASFVLRGDSNRTCESTGWSGNNPSCVFDCGSTDIQRPVNGNVNLTEKTTIGSRAFFSCEVGFELVGDATRTCQLTGWTGSNPTCVAPATAPMTLGQSNAASKQSSSSLKLMFIATITAILLAVTQQ